MTTTPSPLAVGRTHQVGHRFAHLNEYQRKQAIVLAQKAGRPNTIGLSFELDENGNVHGFWDKLSSSPHGPAKHNIEFETRTPSVNLMLCALAVKQAHFRKREEIASLVRAFDYEAHVGGCHVAVMDGGERIAIITSNGPDFK